LTLDFQIISCVTLDKKNHPVFPVPVSAHVIANLTPLGEKYGQVLARSAGPYLVTLLSGSGSLALREASAIALGNISLVREQFKIMLNY